MLKRIWKDPVWSSVIAGGILAVAGVGGTFFLGLWPSIGVWFLGVLAFALRPSELPNWAIWLLGAFGLPTLLLLLSLMWGLVRPNRDVTGKNWRAYTEDEFLGLRWRWMYLQSGNVGRPKPFCPSCDYQVFPHHASAYDVIDRIGFHCDSCGRTLPEFNESFGSLQSKIERFIQQKLRTGGWRESV
jgi:hypothetical protein